MDLKYLNDYVYCSNSQQFLDNDIQLKDGVKKNHGYGLTRKYIQSDTDTYRKEVHSKLYELQRQGTISKFRIVYGSDLIEFVTTNEPHFSHVRTTREFLDTDNTTIQSIQIDNSIQPIENAAIEKVFNGFKRLRLEPTKRFVEAYRINKAANNIWTYYSSAQSKFLNDHDFVNHVDRYIKSVEYFDNLGRTFKGDPEFESIADMITREESKADRMIGNIHKNAIILLQQDAIFNFQLYSQSGLVRLISSHAPDHAMYMSAEQFTDFDYVCTRIEKEKPEPRRRMTNENVKTILHMYDVAREFDPFTYLRHLHIDIPGNKVVTSFSCGGTSCTSSELAIQKYSWILQE